MTKQDYKGEIRNSTVLVDEEIFPNFRKMTEDDFYSTEELVDSVRFSELLLYINMERFLNLLPIHARKEPAGEILDKIKKFFKRYGV